MTFDIYTNRVPFGLLTAEEQKALQDCGGPWEFLALTSWHKITGGPSWNFATTYRAVRPADAAPSPAPADDRDLTIRAALAYLPNYDPHRALCKAEEFVAEARKRGLV
jgi:hypothetical protein